jgi:hypothetical protein
VSVVRALFMAALLASPGTTARAQAGVDESGVIEGVVRDERTREPVAGASVLARRDTAAILLAEAGAHRATSGIDGRFRIGGLRPGAWELTAADPGPFAPGGDTTTAFVRSSISAAVARCSATSRAARTRNTFQRTAITVF